MAINKKNGLIRIFFLASITLMIIVLISYGVIGVFTRPAADDYCVGGQSKIWGVFEGISQRYHNGSAGGARYSYALVTLLIARLPQKFFQFLPFVTIVCYLLATTYFIYQIISAKLNLRNWMVSLFIASNIIGLSFICAPNLYQILYWKVGMLTYTLPNIVLFLFLSFLITKGKLKPQNNIYVIVALIIAYLNGAFNEALLAVQGTILFLWAITEWYLNRNTLLFKMLTAGVFGSIISAIVIYFAPATKMRQSVFPTANQYNLFQVVEKTIFYSTKFIINFISTYTLITGYIILIGIVFALWVRENKPFQLGFSKTLFYVSIICTLCFTLVIGAFATGVIGLGIEIVERTKIVPVLTIIVSFFTIGYTLGIAIPNGFLQDKKVHLSLLAITFFFTAWFTINTTYVNFTNINQLHTFAHEWDVRDQEIRNSPDADVRVTPLSYNYFGGMNELRHFPDHWINQCAAIYYGKESIIVCDRHYPDICLPAVNSDRGDFDCEDIPDRNFVVKRPDPHGLDKDKNGIGCDVGN